MFQLLRSIRYYIALVVVLFAGYVWAGLNGVWLLGDDNQTTENVNGQGGPGSAGGRASRFYHK